MSHDPALPELITDVLHLLAAGESHEQIPARLHRTPSAIARAAYRAGLPELARPFAALDNQLRRARRAAKP